MTLLEIVEGEGSLHDLALLDDALDLGNQQRAHAHYSKLVSGSPRLH